MISEYPDVGASMMEYVRNELEEAQMITQVERTGQRHFYDDDDGKLTGTKTVNEITLCRGHNLQDVQGFVLFPHFSDY